jgi:hypothetical protein
VSPVPALNLGIGLPADNSDALEVDGLADVVEDLIDAVESVDEDDPVDEVFAEAVLLLVNDVDDVIEVLLDVLFADADVDDATAWEVGPPDAGTL